MSFVCPVCGYDRLDEDPRPTAGGGSFEICPSCGFQFGVSDDDRGFTYDAWRQAWIDAGMVWDKGRSTPPTNWHPVQQLGRIGFSCSEMKRPRFYVDFNEMVTDNVVLLSQTDTKRDASGAMIELREGLNVDVYSDDLDEHGNPDALIVSGTVERNDRADWLSRAKWCCRIDSDGIRHQSDLARRTR